MAEKTQSSQKTPFIELERSALVLARAMFPIASVPFLMILGFLFTNFQKGSLVTTTSGGVSILFTALIFVWCGVLLRAEWDFTKKVLFEDPRAPVSWDTLKGFFRGMGLLMLFPAVMVIVFMIAGWIPKSLSASGSDFVIAFTAPFAVVYYIAWAYTRWRERSSV